MSLADFVSGVMNGSIEVVGGGRTADGYYTGVVDPANLTDEDIVAEAINRDISGVSFMRFADLVKLVRQMRAEKASKQSIVDAVFSASRRS